MSQVTTTEADLDEPGRPAGLDGLPGDHLLTTEEAAQALGRWRSGLNYWVKTGRLAPAGWVGRSRVFTVAALAAAAAGPIAQETDDEPDANERPQAAPTAVKAPTGRMRAAVFDAWTRLAEALDGHESPCQADDAPDGYSEDPDERSRAAAVCAPCPARAACLDYALAAKERHGVWGGQIMTTKNAGQRLTVVEPVQQDSTPDLVVEEVLQTEGPPQTEEAAIAPQDGGSAGPPINAPTVPVEPPQTTYAPAWRPPRTECAVCSATTGDGGLCDADSARLRSLLLGVPDLLAELETTRIGLGSGWRAGVVGRNAESRLPFKERAYEATRQLEAVVVGWTLDALGEQAPPRADVQARAGAAAAMLAHLPELRRHDAAGDIVDELADATREAESVIFGGRDRVEVGQCAECGERLHAHPEDAETRCVLCGAVYDVERRREALLTEAAERVVTAREASSALSSWRQHRVSDVTVLRLYAEGHLQALATDLPPPTRFRLGDVAEALERSLQPASPTA